MKRLTYRGNTYQRPDERKAVERVQDDVPHIYRGNVYHYETKKKELVS